MLRTAGALFGSWLILALWGCGGSLNGAAEVTVDEPWVTVTIRDPDGISFWTMYGEKRSTEAQKDSAEIDRSFLEHFGGDNALSNRTDCPRKIDFRFNAWHRQVMTPSGPRDHSTHRHWIAWTDCRKEDGPSRETWIIDEGFGECRRTEAGP